MLYYHQGANTIVITVVQTCVAERTKTSIGGYPFVKGDSLGCTQDPQPQHTEGFFARLEGLETLKSAVGEASIADYDMLYLWTALRLQGIDVR